MHMNSYNFLLWILLFVPSYQIGAQLAIDQTPKQTTCPKVSNCSTSLHFTAFGPMLQDVSTVTGCASTQSCTKIGDVRTCQENHVISVKNEDSATIYLTISGIQNRPTESREHTNYKYEIALFSDNDVTWLVTVGNSSDVSYKFYLPERSNIISRDGLRLSFVNQNVPNEDPQNLLHMSKTQVFTQHKVTSFSEVRVGQLARMTLTTGFDRKESEEETRVDSKSCERVEYNFISPVLTLRQFKANSPTLGCEKDWPVQTVGSRGRAFILDVTNISGNTSRSENSVDLEIVETEQWKENTKTIVVLRSNGVTRWNVNVAKTLASVNYVFVTENSNELNLLKELTNAQTIHTNLDFINQDYISLINSTEALYDCDVVSFMKYESLANLVFLKLDQEKLSKSPNHDDPLPNDQFLAKMVYNEIEKHCDSTRLYVSIPKDVLMTTGLSSDNLKFGNGNCKPFQSNGNLLYELEDSCGLKEEGDTYIVDFEISFTSLNEGNLNLFPSTDDEDQHGIISLPVRCQLSTDITDIRKQEMEKNIETSCEGENLSVRIPRPYLNYLDLSPFKSCRNISSEESVKYLVSKNDGEICHAIHEDGYYKIELPINSKESDVSTEPGFLSLSCWHTNTPVKSSYMLEVFEDFELSKQFSYPANVTIPRSDQDSGKTLHVKVSIISNQPLLRVYLSECTMEDDFHPDSQLTRRIIQNNCPADKSVSFVNPYDSSSSKDQHFSIYIGKSFTSFKQFLIRCSVSACLQSDNDEDIPTIPECFHPHGQSCTVESTKQLYRIPPYNGETINSESFHAVQKSPNEDKRPGLPNIVEKNREESGRTSWFVTLVLGIAAFLFGCLMVSVIWWINHKSYQRPLAPRASSKRCESDNSGESGSSKSTASSRTTSAKSFSCFRTEKEPPTSKQDAMIMKPLIESPTSPLSSPTNCLTVKTIPPTCQQNGTAHGTAANVKQQNNGVIQDDRHMYVKSGNGCLRMSLKSAQVDNESGDNREDPRYDPVRKQKIRLCTHPTDSICDEPGPCNGTIPHTSIPSHTTPNDCPRKTLLNNQDVDWHRDALVVPVTASEFGKLKEVAL